MYEDSPCDIGKGEIFPRNCDASLEIDVRHGMTMDDFVAYELTLMQDALSRSGTPARLRLAGIDSIEEWIPGGLGPAVNDLLDTSTPLHDEVTQARDDHGADVVVIITANAPGNGGQYPGLANSARNPSVIADSERAYFFMVRSRSDNLLLYPHELGHVLGLGHDRGRIGQSLRPDLWERNAGDGDDEYNDDPVNGKPYAFGHVGCDTSTSPNTRLLSLMSYPGNEGGCPSVPATDVLVNQYSNPGLMFAVTTVASGSAEGMADTGLLEPDNGDGAPTTWQTMVADGVTFANSQTELEVLLEREADAARRIRETWSTVASYRSPDPFGAAAEITSPAAGSTVSGLTPPTNVQWTAGTGVGGFTPNYILEVRDAGDPGGFTWYSAETTSTSVSVTLPSGSEVLVARLWTEVDTDRWTWSEIRYNTTGTVRGCSEDPGATWGVAPFGMYDCDLASQPVCTTDPANGIVVCHPGSQTGPESPIIRGIASPTDGDRWYDLAVYGTDRAGDAFCCLISDATGDIDLVQIKGTGSMDYILLEVGGRRMDSYRPTGALECEVRGYSGSDWIVGSNATSSGYDEFLRGYNGHDYLDGRDGNDLLLGGNGDDYLDGGDGFDTLIGRAHDDTLYGGPGWDTLCEVDLEDRMVGSPSWTTADLNTLYYRQNASGTVNSNTTVNSPYHICGHVDHGTSWGDCAINSVILTQPPGACDPWMPD